MVLNDRYKHDGKPILNLSKTQKKAIKEFKKKDYNFVKRKKCPICENDNFEVLSEKDRYGFRFFVVICKDCGLVFANPYFDKKSLSRFYNEDSPKIYRGLEKEKRKKCLIPYFEKQIKRGEKIFKFIKNNFSKVENKRVIEIGCGAGGILQYFKQKGNDCLGVDLDSNYQKIGKKKGLNLYQADIKYLVDKEIKADLIIYSDVLEHIPDINKQLSYARKILKKDGILFIKAPSIKNLEGYQMDFLRQIQNAHIYYFSLTTLDNIMKKNNFELIYGEEEIKAIFNKLPQGNNNVNYVNDYQNIKKYLQSQEKRRKKIKNRLRKFLLRDTKRITNKILEKTGTKDSVKTVIDEMRG